MTAAPACSASTLPRTNPPPVDVQDRRRGAPLQTPCVDPHADVGVVLPARDLPILDRQRSRSPGSPPAWPSMASIATRAATGSDRSTAGKQIQNAGQLRIDHCVLPIPRFPAIAIVVPATSVACGCPHRYGPIPRSCTELPNSSSASDANSAPYPRRWGKEDILGQFRLECLGILERAVDRSVDQSGKNGVDP